MAYLDRKILPIWPIGVVNWISIISNDKKSNYLDKYEIKRVSKIQYDNPVYHTHQLIKYLEWSIVEKYWESNAMIWSFKNGSFAIVPKSPDIYQLAWYTGTFDINIVLELIPANTALVIPKGLTSKPGKHIEISVAYPYNNGEIEYYNNFPKNWFIPTF